MKRCDWIIPLVFYVSGYYGIPLKNSLPTESPKDLPKPEPDENKWLEWD